MYLVTSEEMRKLDRYTIEVLGIPAAELMESAGREVANEIMEHYKHHKSWLVMVGKGNNGGDGLVIARILAGEGFKVEVVFAEAPSVVDSEDLALLRERIVGPGLASYLYQDEIIDWAAYHGIIDALLGTGSKGSPRGSYASLILEANASGLPIVAVDIPSGLDADTGSVSEPCVYAVCTVTFAFMKNGLVMHPGAAVAGRVVVRPIGIPLELAETLGVRNFLLTEEVFRNRLSVDPRRPRREDTHKGTYGHLLVVAGTRRMSGAGFLCSKAALRAGCGVVTWALPNSLVEPMFGHLPEVMLSGVADLGRGDWAETSAQYVLELCAAVVALVIGPGMDRFQGDSSWLRSLWERASCPIVVDADALNMMAGAPDFVGWGPRPAAVVLTPHPGEMARLAGVPVHEVQRDRIGVARRYAVQHSVTLVLKGARTVCATPGGAVYVNVNGNPGMATAGAGDVLAGVIASLLAQGHSAEQAACLGVYLHGAAGDRAAAKRHTPASLIAGDIIEEL